VVDDHLGARRRIPVGNRVGRRAATEPVLRAAEQYAWSRDRLRREPGHDDLARRVRAELKVHAVHVRGADVVRLGPQLRGDDAQGGLRRQQDRATQTRARRAQQRTPAHA